MALTHIHTPITLGGLTLKNRVFRSAHGTLIGGGTVDDNLIAYHEARARGGVALTVMEVMSPHRSCSTLLNMWDARLDEQYPRLIDAMRPHGMKVFQQINHLGANERGADGGPPWSASDIPGVFLGDVPVPMTKSMIEDVVQGYADTAAKCVRWGLDGIEIHGAHGYLLSQFLSKVTNRREDEYGGSFENRARLMLEVMRVVRGAVPNGYPVGIRLSCDLIPGGLTQDDNIHAAKLLIAEQLVDYISLSMGVYQSLPRIIGGMHEPMGYELEQNEAIARALNIPTMVIGRFRTLEEADQVIRSGVADMVGMTRATIADPDLVKKTLAGDPQSVRPCIACNQGCVGGFFAGRMSCTVNPAVGYERSRGDDKLMPVSEPRKILVIGGGPAGMEAARVAATRGHRVILAEAQPRLGGTALLASKAPTRRDIADILVWLEEQVYALGVDVRLSSYMTAEEVIAEEADAVIVATGSVPRLDGVQLSNPGEPIVGLDRSNVLSSADVFLDSRKDLGRTAVVIDDVGHYEAIAVAEELCARGLEVRFVTRHAAFAPGVETALMTEPALKRLSRYSFELLTRTRAIAIDDDGVLVGPTYLEVGSNQCRRLPANTVIVITHNRPNRALYDELMSEGLTTILAGDAHAPRFLPNAINEGNLAGLSV